MEQISTDFQELTDRDAQPITNLGFKKKLQMAITVYPDHNEYCGLSLKGNPFRPPIGLKKALTSHISGHFPGPHHFCLSFSFQLLSVVFTRLFLLVGGVLCNIFHYF